MKAKQLLLMFLMSVVPFFAFAQEEWDDIYASSKPKENKKNEVKQTTQKKVNPSQVLVVRDNGDVTLETTGNVNIDVDAYNRRGGNVEVYEYPQDTIENTDPYQDFQYTDRIVKFHDPANSVKISSENEINVYVTNDLYSNYYRNRGWNFSVNLGWGWGFGSYYPWYDSWYDPWYYSSWGWGWSRPWYYSSW